MRDSAWPPITMNCTPCTLSLAAICSSGSRGSSLGMVSQPKRLQAPQLRLQKPLVRGQSKVLVDERHVHAVLVLDRGEVPAGPLRRGELVIGLPRRREHRDILRGCERW